VSDDRISQRFQLSYGDCDVLGISYFAIYYPWMERTYSTWLYTHGIRSGHMVDDLGVLTVGISSGATYVQAAKVFDELVCRPVLDRIGTSSYRVGFEFTRDGDLVTRGQLTFACRTRDWAKAPIPERLAAALRTLPAPSFDVPAPD